MSLAAVVLPPEEAEAYAVAGELELAYRSLGFFVQDAFRVLEPGRKLRWNWHLTVICDELQEWLRPLWDPSVPPPPPEDLERVLSVPTRMLKTTIVIGLKGWLWMRQPWLTFNGFGNDEDLEETNNLKLMQLVTSAWYQQLIQYVHVRNGGSADDYLPWGISPKKAAADNFDNTAGGKSQAFGMGSTVTGRGADVQTIDDMYDAKKATRGTPDQVAANMKQGVTDYHSVMASRYRDPALFFRLLSMQRLDPDDAAGALIKRGVKAIVFPMEFDPEFPAEFGGVHPRDPRTKPGELLMPQRVSPASWAKMKRDAESEPDGLRHLDAQQNQRPRRKAGGLYKEHHFAHRFAGDPLLLPVDEIAIFVDCSFKGGAQTSHVVMQAWGWRTAMRAWAALLDQDREQLDFVQACERLVRFRRKWALKCRRVILEDKANGPATVSLMKAQIPGIDEWSPGTKSKYERAEIGAVPPMQAGQVWFPDDSWAPWMPGYVARHLVFNGTKGQSNDEVDTSSMACLFRFGEAESPIEKLRKSIVSAAA